jgi:hypothetical protein
MRAIGARTSSLTTAAILLVFDGSVVSRATRRDQPPTPWRPEANEIVQGVQETTKGLGKILTEGATEVQRRVKAADTESEPADAKLEKSAQGFDESMWDGMKPAGRPCRSSLRAAKVV